MTMTDPRLEVVSEPLTYQATLRRDPKSPSGFRAVEVTDEKRSYVMDLIRAEHHYDSDARERLERHGREMEHLRSRRAANLHPLVTGEMEQRAVNWSGGTGGYFAPPQWIIERFATAPRPGRVLADLAPNFDLEPGWSTVSIPRLTTGTLTQAQQLNEPAPDQDVATSAVTSAVTTISGTEDVPLQLIEQSPAGAHFDWVVFTDMDFDYNMQLETQLVSGTGSNNQLLGILNNLPASPNNANIVYTSGSPVATSMFTFLGQAIATVGKNRRLAPETWMMNTSRVGWIATSEDTQQRPLMISDRDGSGEWDLATFGVAVNDSITPTYGAGANQDTIIICRPSDWLILESDSHMDLMFEPLAGQLMARCQLRRYAAALCRYPGGHAAVTGTGMVPVAGF